MSKYDTKTQAILKEVADERRAAVEQHGVQTHLPSFHSANAVRQFAVLAGR